MRPTGRHLPCATILYNVPALLPGNS